MNNELTKEELIKAISKKVSKAKPIVKNDFLSGLKYKNKPYLQRILRVVKVDRDGYGIKLY